MIVLGEKWKNVHKENKLIIVRQIMNKKKSILGMKGLQDLLSAILSSYLRYNLVCEIL